MPHRKTTPFRALASQSRLLMLHELQRRGRPLGVEELAETADVHVNTAREHLERLVAAGFVTRSVEHRATRGRPRVLYSSVAREAGGDFEERFREHLRQATLEHLAQDDADPPEDDRGRVLNQLAALETHFDELRLQPQVDVAELRVDLHQCPFEELARSRTDVVCAVHLAVAQGVLAQEGGPVRAERLEPFVVPGRCTLHLTSTPASAAAEPPATGKG